VTPNERFETKGSKPEIREPPKRRHFATSTVAAETRPFRPCEASIFLRAIARWEDVFQGLSLSTAKCRRLGGAFATGFEP